MPAIEVHELTKRFGRTAAVEDLSFAVEPGRVCGFLGPNGAGKTTTLRMLAGLTRPDGGRARVEGGVGAVLEGFGFHPQRTGEAHLRVLAARAGFDPAEVPEVLERVGLAARGGDPAGTLSLGMRQRLGLASALLGRPRVLLLDEPANGLDPHGLRWLRDLLRDHAAAGGAALVSSHLLAELSQVADSVVVVHRGQLVTAGAIEDVARPALRLRSPERDALLRALERAGLRPRAEGEAVIVEGADPDRVGRAVREAGVLLHEMSPATTLEAAYLGMVGE